MEAIICAIDTFDYHVYKKIESFRLLLQQHQLVAAQAAFRAVVYPHSDIVTKRSHVSVTPLKSSFDVVVSLWHNFEPVVPYGCIRVVPVSEAVKGVSLDRLRTMMRDRFNAVELATLSFRRKPTWEILPFEFIDLEDVQRGEGLSV